MEPVDLDEIRKVIELMKEHDLSFVDLQSGDTKIKLRRGPDLEALQQALASAPPPAAAPNPPPAAANPPASTKEVAPAAPEALPEGVAEITSPMVGTFYTSPDPDSPSFVEVGSRVDEETVVCIIEAMKVMNEIQAETSGTIVEILAKNTDAVQFGEPLFRIKPD